MRGVEYQSEIWPKVAWSKGVCSSRGLRNRAEAGGGDMKHSNRYPIVIRCLSVAMLGRISMKTSEEDLRSRVIGQVGRVGQGGHLHVPKGYGCGSEASSRVVPTSPCPQGLPPIFHSPLPPCTKNSGRHHAPRVEDAPRQGCSRPVPPGPGR